MSTRSYTARNPAGFSFLPGKKLLSQRKLGSQVKGRTQNPAGLRTGLMTYTAMMSIWDFNCRKCQIVIDTNGAILN